MAVLFQLTTTLSSCIASQFSMMFSMNRPALPSIMHLLNIIICGKEAQLTIFRFPHYTSGPPPQFVADKLSGVLIPSAEGRHVSYCDELSPVAWAMSWFISLITVKMDNFTMFTVARGPPIEDLSLLYVNFNVYTILLDPDKYELLSEQNYCLLVKYPMTPGHGHYPQNVSEGVMYSSPRI
ncbi:hypothetical protein F5146DRAFT_1001708 [Armillaria mellea]|nr:hypothetical protein F5146DRAFT_1001708 [Armillaria mellea]